MDPRVAAVMALVRRESGVNVESLATATNLSPSRLRHLFKVETSQPIGLYMKRRRLGVAEQLLRDTFLSVKQVAGASGFKAMSHFVREFRKTVGVPPAAFRRIATRDNE